MRRRKKSPPARAYAPTVELFAALAHPMRLKVLVALDRSGPMSAGALQKVVGAEQSALSHQLSTLRRHRLVKAERDGRQVIYSLLDAHVAHIVDDAIAHANERKSR